MLHLAIKIADLYYMITYEKTDSEGLNFKGFEKFI